MTELQDCCELVIAAGLSTGHADTHKDLIAEVLLDVAGLKSDLKQSDYELNNMVTVGGELQDAINKLEELNKTLVRDLDECQRAHDKLAGISNE